MKNTNQGDDDRLFAAVARVQERTLELADPDLVDPGVYRLALLVSLDADETAVGRITKERMIAFAEEVAAVVRPTIYRDIVAERVAQEAEWGGPKHDDEHDLVDWVAFIGKQLVRAEYSEGFESARAAMVKVAALAVACVESLERRDAR